MKAPGYVSSKYFRFTYAIYPYYVHQVLDENFDGAENRYNTLSEYLYKASLMKELLLGLSFFPKVNYAN